MPLLSLLEASPWTQDETMNTEHNKTVVAALRSLPESCLPWVCSNLEFFGEGHSRDPEDVKGLYGAAYEDLRGFLWATLNCLMVLP